MLVAYSGRCRWPARVHCLAVVLLFACLGFGAVAADGFVTWDKTQMWSNDCQIRGFEWVDGHGWFAAGSGAFDDGGEFPSISGVVLQSATGASGMGVIPRGRIAQPAATWHGTQQAPDCADARIRRRARLGFGEC
jgi:hypothetical protein